MTRKNHGENNGKAKLTVEAVNVIRHLLRCGHQAKEIAEIYGISKSLVSAIKANKVWNAPVEQMEKPMERTTVSRLSKDDIDTIVEEVLFLVNGGYRGHDRDQILRGLDIALESATPECWKRWVTTQLQNVIQEMYAIGAETI